MRRLSCTLFSLFTCLVGYGFGTPGWAQPAPQATASANTDAAADAAKADEFFKQGKAFFAAGKFKEAYKAYKTAWSFEKRYDIAGNLGNVAFTLGRMRDAAEYLTYCKIHFPAGGPPEASAKLDKLLHEARKQVGTLKLPTLECDCNVFVDGERVSTDEDAPQPFEVFVEPGTHSVEVTRTGFKSAQTRIQAEPGTTQEVALSIPSTPENAPSPIAAQPMPPAPVANGTDGAGDHGTPRLRTALIVVGTTLTTAGAITGVVAAVLSNGKASEADNAHDDLEKANGSQACASSLLKAPCDNLKGLRDAQASLANISVWGFIGAGAIGAGTVAYYVLSGRSTTETSPNTAQHAPSVSLAVSPRGGGFVVRGTW